MQNLLCRATAPKLYSLYPLPRKKHNQPPHRPVNPSSPQFQDFLKRLLTRSSVTSPRIHLKSGPFDRVLSYPGHGFHHASGTSSTPFDLAHYLREGGLGHSRNHRRAPLAISGSYVFQHPAVSPKNFRNGFRGLQTRRRFSCGGSDNLRGWGHPYLQGYRGP